MDFETLSRSRRTVRRFQQIPVPDGELRHLIDMARCASCGANRQQLRYVVIRNRNLVKKVFDSVAWAMLVAPRRTPTWGVDAPPCFIAVTAPAGGGCIVAADAGAAIQSMQLAAWERGIGCCWFASFDPERVKTLLDLPGERRVLFLVAVGYSGESPVMEEARDGNVAYYLDEHDRLHVPKLPVDEISRWM